jgi:hypothetical protein
MIQNTINWGNLDGDFGPFCKEGIILSINTKWLLKETPMNHLFKEREPRKTIESG